MQVPEKLSLIGGSILLTSALVFTLKSQASSILPKITHPISTIYTHAGDAQEASDFGHDFEQAQKNGQKTGNWGSAKYYIDKESGLHVGSGDLQTNLRGALGGDLARSLKSIHIDGNVKAPADSLRLLTSVQGQWDYNYNLTTITGLDHIDTSQVTSMRCMFYGEMSLDHIDISSWDTHNVNSMYEMFDDDEGMNDLNVSGIDVSHVQDMRFLFWHDRSLTNLDLGSWHTDDLNDMSYIFGDAEDLQSVDLAGLDTSHADMAGLFQASGGHKLRSIQLGDHTYLKDIGYLPDGNWEDGNTTLNTNQLRDGHDHAGTWFKQ